ncbi:aminotransferase class V-fold PLP-dependent enzyme [Epidermidibacterium keratini]|uniref:Aminotransferase class V-fold PLP-dependent enzyme n=1 Tax=Epidermidibacterium keratini TaxID=1891644 RepID=A0A7L4YR94_9ACTN|nr:cysteine desulfurase family protein [Epidermidibacterium keratini]QHC01765.1 aminotransferase class V-fold PLP-dependent enzyme [Epidermidibacterium keratini]
MNQVYLDHAATTVIRESVIEAMTAVMRDVGNASSTHTAGRRARQRVEEAREQIGEALGADPIEVIFTSGATESDNLAIKGGALARYAEDPRRRRIVVSPAEHHAVLDSARWLADERDFEITWVEVDGHGSLPPARMREALDGAESAAIATAMWANNEVGALSDIPAIAAICAGAGVPFHTDAVQAVGRVPIDFRSLGASTLAISGHKIGGPQGVGALLAQRSFKPVVQAHGGGQERRVRSGTLDVAGIVGLGVAVSEAEKEREAESDRLGGLRDELVNRLHEKIEGLKVNGYERFDAERALPGVVNLHLPGAAADAVLMLVDSEGMAISTGSACSAGVTEPSPVILAMTGDDARSRSSVRISLGRTTTPDEVDRIIAVLPDVVERARIAGG